MDEFFFSFPDREIWDKWPQFFRAGEDPEEDYSFAEESIDDVFYLRCDNE